MSSKKLSEDELLRFWTAFYTQIINNILNCKKEISQLFETQNELYSNLIKPLRLSQNTEDRLFDFIYNNCGPEDVLVKQLVKDLNRTIASEPLSEEMEKMILDSVSLDKEAENFGIT